MPNNLPNPRFEKKQQIFDANKKPIGFQLPECTFLFRFRPDGGWLDENEYLYDKDGVLVGGQETVPGEDEVDLDDEQPFGDQNDDQDDDQIDEEVIGQLQKIMKTDKPSHNKEPTDFAAVLNEIAAITQATPDKERRKCIPQFIVYFRSKPEEKPQIVTKLEGDSIAEKEELARKVTAVLMEQKHAMIAKNPWLGTKFSLQVTGTCQKDRDTFRFWFGQVRTNADQFLAVIEACRKSSDFVLFENKTLYALKSKIAKKAMVENINKMAGELNGMQEDEVATIKLGNLPQNLPMSVVIDFLELVGVSSSEIIEVSLGNDTSDIKLLRNSALKAIHLEGYNYSFKRHVEIDLEIKKEKYSFGEKVGIIKIRLSDMNKKGESPYYEVMGVLGLDIDKARIWKFFKAQDDDSLIVNSQVLRPLLMFRSPWLEIIRLRAYEWSQP